MPKREVLLTGEEHDLNKLYRIFVERDPKIEKRDGEYLLISSKINAVLDPDQVKALLQELILFINGIARLQDHNYLPVRYNRITDIEDSGRKMHYITAQATVRTSVSLTTDSIDPLKEEMADAYRLLDLAEHDKSVAKALRLLNREQNWSELYKIYEIIEEDVKNNTLLKSWANNVGDIDRFTASANNSSITGDNSRHGKLNSGTPKRTMDLSEAKSLISRILTEWLNSKK